MKGMVRMEIRKAASSPPYLGKGRVERTFLRHRNIYSCTRVPDLGMIRRRQSAGSILSDYNLRKTDIIRATNGQIDNYHIKYR